jgi:hypothetical protein
MLAQAVPAAAARADTEIVVAHMALAETVQPIRAAAAAVKAGLTLAPLILLVLAALA